MGFFDFLTGGSDKKSTFNFQPYSGSAPPTTQFLRPVEKQITDILMRRSQGEDVGFDPARRQLMVELLRSQIGAQTEDDVRSAQGLASRAGLSGNLRAQEALEGRVRRDSARTLGQGVTQIGIEDLTRAADDRNLAIGRLADLNQFNFGQQNAVANFDLDRFQTEQTGRIAQAQSGLANRQIRQSALSDIGGLIGDIGGALINRSNRRKFF